MATNPVKRERMLLVIRFVRSIVLVRHRMYDFICQRHSALRVGHDRDTLLRIGEADQDRFKSFVATAVAEAVYGNPFL